MTQLLQLRQCACLSMFSFFLALVLLKTWFFVTYSLPTIFVITPTASIAIGGENTLDCGRRINKDKGDLQRNLGLSYLHHKYGNGSNVSGVVYFADDDNSYDVRLFNNYIRHVKRVGVWAVGSTGDQKVESPSVVDGRVVGWNVGWAPGRKFATDMAGFAVNLHTIFETNASFKGDCRVGFSETCFLEQINVTWDQLEPFGFDTQPKRNLVWHTKTGNGGTKGDSFGFVV